MCVDAPADRRDPLSSRSAVRDLGTGNGAQSADVINIYWEEELETDIDDLRARLGIEKPPDLRAMRKAEREARKKEKEGKENMARAAV